MLVMLANEGCRYTKGQAARFESSMLYRQHIGSQGGDLGHCPTGSGSDRVEKFNQYWRTERGQSPGRPSLPNASSQGLIESIFAQ